MQTVVAGSCRHLSLRATGPAVYLPRNHLSQNLSRPGQWLVFPQPSTARPRSLWKHGRHSGGAVVLCSSNARSVSAAFQKADEMRQQLAKLETEHDEALTRAKASADKSKRLTVRVESLQQAALRAVKGADERAARQLLQEKAVVLEACAKAKERSQTNHALATKLDRLISQKQTQLIAVLASSDTLLEEAESPAWPLGPPGSADVGGSQAPFAGDAAGIAGHSTAWEQEVNEAFHELQQDSTGPAQATPDVIPSEQHRQEARPLSDVEVDDVFLDMERNTLEIIFQASAAVGDMRNSERGDAQTPVSSMQGRSDGGDGAASSSSGPTWWHNGNIRLQEQDAQQRGRSPDVRQLEAINSRAVAILRSLANGRMQARDPKVSKMVELAALAWQVQRERGRRIAMPANCPATLRTNIFRAAVAACIRALAADSRQLWEQQFAPQFSADDVPSFLVSLADCLQVTRDDAVRIVTASAAACTRSSILDATAALQGSPDAIERPHATAEQDLLRLKRVLDVMAPPPGTAELEMVFGGLKAFVSPDNRRQLMATYRGMDQAQCTSFVVAEALGLQSK